MLTDERPHIAVLICTFRRPPLLKRLLEELGKQEVDGELTYSVVVVDNDSLRSAEPVVSRFAAKSALAVKYCVEPRQNIPLARNRAVENATGEFVAFIDDDEFPTERWLLTLLRACREYKADGVIGTVRPHFEHSPPVWVREGKFYERPTYPTGYAVEGRQGRTGNLLLRKTVFDPAEAPFRQEFVTGEDQDFFTRQIEKGRRFVWCDEAVAYETIPQARWNRSFMLRRALLRGATSLLHPSCGALNIAKSVIAIPIYAVALPFTLIVGRGTAMSVAVRLFDHLGKVLALVGIRPVPEPYVTE